MVAEMAVLKAAEMAVRWVSTRVALKAVKMVVEMVVMTAC